MKPFRAFLPLLALVGFATFGFSAFSFTTAASPHMERMQLKSEFDFLAGMIPHHEGALESAVVALERTERPEVRELAQAIIAAQTAEVETMQGWLEAWYPERSTDAAEADMDAHMTGMGAEALRGLSGDAFDKAFLEGMMAHHKLAVQMAEALLEGDLSEHAEVEGLAHEVIETQTSEIDRMQTWLEAWYGASTPSTGHGAH
jgi:uncharacterized protein (DUF305 family)